MSPMTKHLTNDQLASKLDAEDIRRSRARNSVNAHAANTSESFSDIRARLGEAHPAVNAYRMAARAYLDIEAVARGRLDGLPAGADLAAMLRLQPMKRA
jgi:hypothetical protein